MQRIPVRLAKPGMILAKPLLRDNGLVLIAEGTEISESLVSRLATMNIESIVVKGSPLNLEGMGDSSSFSKRIERMDHLFRKYRSDPFMMKLKMRLKEYFQLKAAAQAAAEAAEAAEAEAALEEKNPEKGEE